MEYRAARRLPAEILRHVVSFVPSRTHSVIHTGIREFRRIVASKGRRDRVFRDVTCLARSQFLVPLRAARSHWEKQVLPNPWVLSVIHEYRDDRYGIPCVIYEVLRTGNSPVRWAECAAAWCVYRADLGLCLHTRVIRGYETWYDATTHTTRLRLLRGPTTVHPSAGEGCVLSPDAVFF